MNNQQNQRPLEKIDSYLHINNNSEYVIDAIGATRYAEFGEKTYLQTGDEVIVAVYEGANL